MHILQKGSGKDRNGVLEQEAAQRKVTKKTTRTSCVPLNLAVKLSFGSCRKRKINLLPGWQGRQAGQPGRHTGIQAYRHTGRREWYAGRGL